MGINIRKVYCVSCNQVYLQLFSFSAETSCPCVKLPKTCTSCCEKKKSGEGECMNTRQEYAYYKVAGDCSMEQQTIRLLDVSLTATAVSFVQAEFVYPDFFISCELRNMDVAPPPEWLCTFLC